MNISKTIVVIKITLCKRKIIVFTVCKIPVHIEMFEQFEIYPFRILEFNAPNKTLCQEFLLLANKHTCTHASSFIPYPHLDVFN